MSIQVRNLTHIYAKGLPDQQTGIENVNFDIYDGEIVGVIGPTGSGKSTLLQHLNGLLKPERGTVVIENTDITKPGVSLKNIRRKVGLVFQYPENQLFEETVGLDVAFGPKNLGISEAEINDRVREALELVGIDYETFKDRSPFELSGGQKRKIAIAGVIAMKPHVLILDEPTAGLDPGAHRDILHMMEEVHRALKNIIIFVSHDMADIVRLSDRVMVMNRGKLAMLGTPEEVFSHRERLKSMRLDVPPVTRLMCELRERGIEVRDDLFTIREARAEIYDYLTRGL